MTDKLESTISVLKTEIAKWERLYGELAKRNFDMQAELDSLIPEPSALDRRLTEARLEGMRDEHGEQCDCGYENGNFIPCERRELLESELAELRRVVKGESNA